MMETGIPERIRSDNGPEFVANGPAQLAGRNRSRGAETLYIEPGSPWENGNCESFNSKLRDEFLNGEILYTLKDAQVLAERWRVCYNTEWLHSSRGYTFPAPAAWKAKRPNQQGAWRSGKRCALPASPDPRLRWHY
jgi:transposase InsO family protein